MRTALILMLLGSVALADTPAPFAAFHSASPAILNDPHDLAFGPDGNLYIADKFANSVAIMDPDTLEVIGSIGNGALFGVHDVSFSADGTLYAAVTGLSAVVAYDLSGETPAPVGQFGPFSRTEGVLAHSNGQIYVVAAGTGQLIAITPAGELVASVAGLSGAHDVAEAPDGTVWVADTFNRRLVQFAPDLTQIREIKGAQYGFIGPRYLDFTPGGVIIIADQDAHRILRIDPIDGAILGIIGTGKPGLGANQFDDPEGVVVRGSDYYFTDSDNNRVVKYIVALN